MRPRSPHLAADTSGLVSVPSPNRNKRGSGPRGGRATAPVPVRPDARLVVRLPGPSHRERRAGPGLASALVWFRCTHVAPYGPSCAETTIGYPRVLVHAHVRRERRYAADPQSADDDLANAVRENCLRSPYAFDAEELRQNITFDLHASFAAAEIVRTCGLDPATATAEDMDRRGARVACVPCKKVMTWRKAVSVSDYVTSWPYSRVGLGLAYLQALPQGSARVGAAQRCGHGRIPQVGGEGSAEDDDGRVLVHALPAVRPRDVQLLFAQGSQGAEESYGIDVSGLPTTS